MIAQLAVGLVVAVIALAVLVAVLLWAAFEITALVSRLRSRRSRRHVPGLPEDGEPLDDEEMSRLVVIRHGYPLSAAEPRRAARRRP